MGAFFLILAIVFSAFAVLAWLADKWPVSEAEQAWRRNHGWRR